MRVTPRAFFNTEPILEVGEALIAELKRQAAARPEQCFRLCLHAAPEDPVQTMIIAALPGSYCRPHLHPRQAVSYVAIEGTFDVVLFDDGGAARRVVRMGPGGSGRTASLHLAANRWHAGLYGGGPAVFCEVMAGPYRREDVNVWAPWSPEEGDTAGVAAFLRRLEAPR